MNVNKFKPIENIEVATRSDFIARTSIDPVTAIAYDDSVAAAENANKVIDQLEDAAKSIITEDPETIPVKEDTMYTGKFKLDEAMDDYKPIDPKSLSDKSDEDDYLDFDMFDFIYSFVTDSGIDVSYRPINPLGKKSLRKFSYFGYDRYTGDGEAMQGVNQVSVGNNTIVVYANDLGAFDDIKKICDIYKFNYEGPTERKDSTSHWKYNFTIKVPTTANDYPMDVEDYFESIGMSLEDVMPPAFIRNLNRRRDSEYKALNDYIVDSIYKKWSDKGGQSNDPVQIFVDGMLAELAETSNKLSAESNGKQVLTYNAKKLAKQLKDYLEDDFGEEDN